VTGHHIAMLVIFAIIVGAAVTALT